MQNYYHKWDIAPKEAVRLQLELKDRVLIKKCKNDIKTVLGLDVSYEKEKNLLFSGGILLNIDDGGILEECSAVGNAVFPYVPGLLSFREIPILLKALENLSGDPDVIICDGHGLSHPRRFGLACHLGVLLDKPVMGIAKKSLTGDFEMPGLKKGEYNPVIQSNELLGYVYRTKNEIKPVFVSPGHKISFEQIIQIMEKITGKYRIPEPTRLAHNLVNKIRKQY